jgi:hypothetical protein
MNSEDGIEVVDSNYMAKVAGGVFSTFAITPAVITATQPTIDLGEPSIYWGGPTSIAPIVIPPGVNPQIYQGGSTTIAPLESFGNPLADTAQQIADQIKPYIPFLNLIP